MRYVHISITRKDLLSEKVFYLEIASHFCRQLKLRKTKVGITFVELGGGVGDVPFWCRDGAYVEFGFR